MAPPTVSGAVSTQHSPTANTAASAIPEPENGADLELPHGALLPTTLEAARIQHLPAVNAGSPAIPDPEDSTDLALPPPPWPPDEAAEPPAHQLPKLIQALTDAGGLLVLESLPS